MPANQTSIATLGEIGLIERIRALADVPVNDPVLRDNLVIGISDDAAVYRPTPGKVQLITTDALVEGVHFDLTFTSLKHLGWKAIVASLSDIAAMGGLPLFATVTLALPQKISVEMVEDFYEGARSACRKYSCLIVGGDTTASMAAMMVSVAMTGEAAEERIVFRGGAKVGDLIGVTGHLGASAAGLKVLQREKQQYLNASDPLSFQPNLEIYKDAIEKHLMPKPRLDISRMFAGQVQVHSGIDISDGLASEVHRICRESKVGAKVYERNIPVKTVTEIVAKEFSENPTDYALYGGEEYELLFTLTDEEYKKLDRLTNDVSVVGRIVDKNEGIVLIGENGKAQALRFGGWDHFITGSSSASRK